MLQEQLLIDIFSKRKPKENILENTDSAWESVFTLLSLLNTLLNTKSLSLTQVNDMLESDKEIKHLCLCFNARSAMSSPDLEILEVPANIKVT